MSMDVVGRGGRGGGRSGGGRMGGGGRSFAPRSGGGGRRPGGGGRHRPRRFGGYRAVPYVAYPVVVYDDDTDYVLLPEGEEEESQPRRRRVRGYPYNDIIGAVKSIHADPKTPRIHIGFLADCVVGALWG